MVKKRVANNYPDPDLDPDTGLALMKSRDRHQQLIDGVIQVDDLTIEELQKGKVKVDGKFCQRKIPLGVSNRIARELNKRLLAEFNKYGIDAIDTITDIMYRGEGASAFQGQKDGVKRLEAAKYVIERIVGPIPTKSEVTQTVTVWEQMNETGGLFVDVEVENIQEVESVQKAEPAARKRGPRTRPRRASSEMD